MLGGVGQVYMSRSSGFSIAKHDGCRAIPYENGSRYLSIGGATPGGHSNACPEQSRLAVFRQQICACKGEKGSKRVRFALKSQEQSSVLIDQGEGPLDNISTGGPRGIVSRRRGLDALMPNA